MTVESLAKVVKSIRIYLGYSQDEFAKKINTQQTLLSRFENGKSSSLEMVISIYNLLTEQGYSAIEMFREPFNVERLRPQQQSVNIQQIKETVKLMNEENQATTNRLLILLDTLDTTHP